MKGKIHFIWQGISNPKIREHWKDGLYAAMQLLEKEYDVTYGEPWDDVPSDATIMYWEAPCTIRGENAHHYMNVMNKLNKKILLFAGGPIKTEWVKGFDMICVESKVNLEEFQHIGMPVMTAFGINDEIFKQKPFSKVYDGVHHGTCASWKRQHLVGEALGDRGLLVGRYQETDPMPFEVAKRFGAIVLDQQPYEKVCDLLNQSHCLVQTSDEWGGGQRATLEAMACGLPVVCMSDSPKNREYVEESGWGIVVEPDKHQIAKAVDQMKTLTGKNLGIEYIASKWTAKHYANALKEAICAIQ